MNQTITSSIAIVAFFAAMFATYIGIDARSQLDTFSPVVVLDNGALTSEYTNATTEEERETKYKIAMNQVRELGAAGYIVINMNGKVMAFPEELRLTPEILGVTNGGQ